MPVDHQRSRHLFIKLNRLLSRVPAHPTPEAVHQLRTTTRRVEALLEALAPESDRNQRKLARSLKRVRRRAGRIRDLDVHLGALRSLKIGRDTSRKQQLINQLAERRSRQESKLLKRLDRISVQDLRRRLRRAAQLALGPAAEGPNPSRTAVRRTRPNPSPKPMEEPLARALRMFGRLVRETGPLTDANLHQFRTRSKRIRYVAEIGGDTREVQSVVKEFKRLQDAVGAWHDWLTLTQTADELFAGASDSALLNALQNITRAKFVEALRTSADVKRTLLAIRLPAPRPSGGGKRTMPPAPARSKAAPPASARPAAHKPKPARAARRPKPARKPKPSPEVQPVEAPPPPEQPEAAQPQAASPETAQPEAARPKPTQPEPSEPDISEASA